MTHQCKFCDAILANEYSLSTHQKKTKKCLIKQGIKIPEGEFKCELCNEKFIHKTVLNNHLISCNKKNILLNYKKLETKYNTLENKYNILETKYNMILEDKEKLLDKITTAALSPVYDVFEDPSTILIEEDNNESEENEEEYKLTPLEVGDGYTIEHREEDGFINVTNLCKAGDKQFKAWNRLDKTKAFLQVLSSSVLIHTDELIKYNTGSNHERATWVHPQVAINIAQWISPTFDVKVSGWVYEVMMTGKVDITNTKSYKELQKENKNKELKIQFLTKKYVKRQPRVDYQERNVVYILTTANMKKERRYILGKAENLTNRLSVYNKSDEHEVIYYQECSDEDKMNIVETTVFNKLKECREQTNRERFILPENKEIEYFKDTIKKVIEFVN